MASKRISKMKKVMAGLSSGGDKKATSSQRKKVVDDPVSGGDANKSTASRRKKVPKVAKKENLVEQMRKHKKGVQEMRFGFSGGGQEKGGSRRNLRKQIAQVATQLTVLRKNGGGRV